MKLIEIDFGSVVGKRRLVVEDEVFARELAHLYGGATSVGSNEGSTATIFQELRGSDEDGFFLDEYGPMDKGSTLGLLDFQFDAAIRACKTPRLCAVHSCGLIAPSGKALAVLGQSGSGKTTLGLACALAGLDYMGDEFGFLDLENGQYSHVRYPLCVRQTTWGLFGISSPDSDSTSALLSPLDNVADMVAVEEVLGRGACCAKALPLAGVLVPRRNIDAGPALRTLSVAEWPEYLMPSLDAVLPRDTLFRKLVALVSFAGIKVFLAEYDRIEDGVELVWQACDRIR